jgi:osmotically-inducible protein OsmY
MKTMNRCKVVASLMGMVLAGYVYAQSKPLNTGSQSAITFMGSAGDESVADDRQLSEQVRAALAKAQNVEVSNIFVVAHEGKVILTGTAQDESQIALASQVAKSVKGVESVSNRLTIQER